jgi:flagellar M-ring protein FliF
MNGIKAARVHIVLPDEGSFRRNARPASASVVIRTESADGAAAAQAIRHLVAAAVPGMKLDDVTVLDTDGVLLASGDDTGSAAPGKMVSLEKMVSDELQDSIRKTLTPYLGLDNFQISVMARLNTDKKQTTETIFDPDSRVERSVRVVKENEASQNQSTQTPTSVEQNLPEQKAQPDSGEQSSVQNDRREETTNYELSSKTVTTVSDGYLIDRLSIAVLVNRARLVEALGDKATPEAIDERLADIEQLAASAAGLSKERGDQIKVTAVDFVADSRALEPVPPLGLKELLVRQSGTFINAGTILVVAMLLIWFGLRPATRAILTRPPAAEGASAETAALPSPEVEASQPAQLAASPEASLIEDLTSKLKRSPQKRLEQMIQFDELQAAAILKQWMHQEERA